MLRGNEEELVRLRQLLAEKDRELAEKDKALNIFRSLEDFYDPIEGTPLKKPVIASDGYIYEESKYQELILQRNDSSFPPYRPFRESPYPFGYKKLEELLANPTSVTALRSLCVDPVSGELMKDPYIATLKIFKQGELIDGVIVCDKSTLDLLALHDPVKVVTSRQFTQLKDLIQSRLNEMATRKDPSDEHGLAWLESSEMMSEYFVPVRRRSAPNSGFHVLGPMPAWRPEWGQNPNEEQSSAPYRSDSGGFDVLGPMPKRPPLGPRPVLPAPVQAKPLEWGDSLYSAPSSTMFARKDAGSSDNGARCDTPGCDSNPRTVKLPKPGSSGG
jgi:hypothetical protein